MMPTRNLGKTGFRVGVFGLGGPGALEKTNNEAIAVPIIEKALALRCRPQESGRIVDTDHLDTWQLHDVGTLDEVDQIFGKGGTIEAFLQARDQKMARHLGVTGRFRPDPLMESIRRFPFDTILMGLNAADKYYYSFAKDLLPMAVEKQMGIIGMKVMARGRILSSWTPPPVEVQKKSWEGTGAIATTPGTLTKHETMFYRLSLPISTAIIGCDSVEQVEECVQLARDFSRSTRSRWRRWLTRPSRSQNRRSFSA
jgi:aryl-alcohol dehydrogenase-like predicted oxidoreductase